LIKDDENEVIMKKWGNGKRADFTRLGVNFLPNVSPKRQKMFTHLRDTLVKSSNYGNNDYCIRSS
jgi:hypothetical protein